MLRRIGILSAALVVGLAAFLAVGSSVHATTINFDQLSTGDTVTSLEGVTFGSNTGFELVVSNQFETSSPTNYLGVDDGGSQVFIAGDVITFDFASPILSFSLSVLSTPLTPVGAYVLDGGLSGSDVSDAPTSTLPFGTEVFVLSVASPSPFFSLALTSELTGVFSFNIDDVSFEPANAAPEPSLLLLLAPSGAWLALHRRRLYREERS